MAGKELSRHRSSGGQLAGLGNQATLGRVDVQDILWERRVTVGVAQRRLSRQTPARSARVAAVGGLGVRFLESPVACYRCERIRAENPNLK
jgi:hypothetical protein